MSEQHEWAKLWNAIELWSLADGTDARRARGDAVERVVRIAVLDARIDEHRRTSHVVLDECPRLAELQAQREA